ncbi:hypothetical protein DNTS_032298 [Danionella cerebrum]|uniref:alanine transaminase n=1 Tax=Danionella cerebrum TaxID=2873325 RepID=A0A553QGF3_9TELE|nr:hypothetical protein DNTS_032298 [Danionella translucida]
MQRTSRDASTQEKQDLQVLDVSSCDFQSTGLKPITFVRQVIAECLCPSLLQNNDAFPVDALLRAQTLLQHCDGGSVGSYTESCGSMFVRTTIARSISERDGVPSSPEQIFVTLDTQRGLMVMMRLLCQSKGVSAMMIPDPAPQGLTCLLERIGMASLPYQLREENGWSYEMTELKRVIQESRGRYCPHAIFISNPNEPTGHVQSRESMEEVIRFAADEDLFIVVNEGSAIRNYFTEVYQDSVFGMGSEFISYKRVLSEMENQYSSRVQLASLHSLSNIIMGEFFLTKANVIRVGFRTGFMELVNVDEDILLFTEVLLTGDLCPPVIGQIALDVMMAPPLPGDSSHCLYTQEVCSRLQTLRCNALRAVEFINNLPGLSCPSIQSGVFIFPQLTHSHTQSLGMLYRSRLFEEQRLYVGFSEDHTHAHNSCRFRYRDLFRPVDHTNPAKHNP